jgi:hypothetical protein
MSAPTRGHRFHPSEPEAVSSDSGTHDLVPRVVEPIASPFPGEGGARR